MTKNHMLTTMDNPFNPFTHWDEWYQYDYEQGHHSLALLARVTRTSDELSEELQSQDIEDAILEIVTENVSGLHIRVTEDWVPFADHS
ncbi:hypothetical protein [Streptomyces phage Psst4]|uniref:Uncharacterized protein n=14 Tax=Rimavirus rima TaxID=2560784 RepID=A0A515MIT7_9CAUD|nr:hypothetical protein FDH06_gp87 [Streptomyces phage Rima]AOZ64952.1 hypothetical protein SEA_OLYMPICHELADO_88 [Streptomyces phage OlympicHelado]ASU04080.1 hypothetical protein SEA_SPECTROPATRONM_85 [Streptomyces phage Spectropatronm]QAY16386.1 hypothetical protein SEA_NAMO_88 [Streptomyces phage Namo]QDM56583.1 hypothetical protein SEA_ESKETIT_82 [Streptomyces phage Esketit]QEQ93865.1 hypothetical protein SEA_CHERRYBLOSSOM_86 [Streptomyces phage CherryBlossom]QEQ94031.1 hypothetical protei